MDYSDIQRRKLPVAADGADLATVRLGQAGLDLTIRQRVIVQGAFLQVLVNAAISRVSSFCQSVTEETLRREELGQLDDEELADLLMDRVWSMMDESEESSIVEAAIDRLRGER